MEFPNEIICQFYQHLNPNDQLRFAATAKTIRECAPDWKHDHQGSFTNCIKQINAINYKIIIRDSSPEPDTSTVPTPRDGRALIVSASNNGTSRRVNGKKIVKYYYFSHSMYAATSAINRDFVHIKSGSPDKYDLNKPLSDYSDVSIENGLTNKIVNYKNTIYDNQN
jgi:hypothetical protein